MNRGNLNDLLAFLAVGQERSFTKAAAKLGVSQSALSHTIRGLEERLGLWLLTRTTRSVSPTEVGERLLHTIGPRFEEIEAELGRLSELREKPAGTIRITATDYAADTILWPKLTKLLRHSSMPFATARLDQPPTRNPIRVRLAGAVQETVALRRAGRKSG
jgi:DNA-binding transcriptional LysR family regulator